jgi:hypothetical protein
MISVDIKVPKGLNKLQEILNRNLITADKEIANLLLTNINRNKRYEDRTGRLTSAIKVKGDITKGLSIYLDENVANYAKFVHGGQQSWKADQFLYNSINESRDTIISIVTAAVNKSVAEFNRG